jgi:hypothetical protein
MVLAVGMPLQHCTCCTKNISSFVVSLWQVLASDTAAAGATHLDARLLELDELAAARLQQRLLLPLAAVRLAAELQRHEAAPGNLHSSSSTQNDAGASGFEQLSLIVNAADDLNCGGMKLRPATCTAAAACSTIQQDRMLHADDDDDETTLA